MVHSTKEPWNLTPPPPRTETQTDLLFDIRLIFRTQWRSFRGAMQASPETAWGMAAAGVFIGPILIGLWIFLFMGVMSTFAGRAPGPDDAAAVNVTGAGFPLMAAMFTLVSAGTTLSHSTVMPLLFTLPVRRHAILTGIVMQQAVTAVWGAFMMTAPSMGLLAAHGRLVGGAVPVLLSSVAASLVMSCIAVFLGATVVRLLPGGRWREWTLIISSCSGLFCFYLLQALATRASRSGDPAAYLEHAGSWIPRWIPPSWPGTLAAQLTTGGLLLGYVLAVALLIIAVLLCWGLVAGLDTLYQHGLGSAPTGGADGRSSARRQLVGKRSWVDGQVRAVALREWRRITRSPRLLANGFAAMIPAIAPWVINGAGGPMGLRVALVFGLSFGAETVSLSMVGSEEGAFWITRLSPLPDKAIVCGKAAAVMGLFGGMAVLATAMAGSLGGVPVAQYAPMLLQNLLAAALSCAAGLAAGSSEPIFNPPNKQQYAGISAALGATFGMMFWLGLMIGLRFLVAYTVAPQVGEAAAEWLFTVGAWVVNLPIIIGLFGVAARSLSKVVLKA